jgi:hypothetical protein
MAKFLIAAADPRKNSVMPLIYDNMESTLTDIQGNSVSRMSIKSGMPRKGKTSSLPPSLSNTLQT